jgi:GTP-binding protein EngB required for normal cell division
MRNAASIDSQSEQAPRVETTALLRELHGLSADILDEDSRATLEAGLRRLEGGQFNLVVLGEFKRGKSSLVNALIGKPVLPTGVVPLTSAVTVVRGGERQRLLVGFADGGERERPYFEMDSFATEEGNPGNVLGVESIAVEVESPLLDRGMRLIDTPGIGSTHERNTETALGFLPQVDAAIVVLAADQPLSAAELELTRRLEELTPRLIFALNRIDLLGAEEIDAARRFVLAQLTREGRDGGAELFCLSARTGEGVDRLAAYLGELARRDGRHLTRATVRAGGAGLAAEAAALAELERAALRMPLRELEERVERFELGCADLLTARSEAADLLELGLRRLLEEVVDEPLGQLPERLEPTLARGLRNHAQVVSTLTPRQLAIRLDDWTQSAIRQAFGAEQSRLGGILATRVAELQSDHARRIEALLEELDAIAGEAFGTEVGLGRLREVGMRRAPRLSFKLEDPEHMLETLLGGLRRLAPGPLGCRLVLRDAERRLAEMVDRHAGRLRSALTEQAREAVSEYRRDLRSAVEEAVGEIRAAAERARAEHRRGTQGVGARLDRLDALRARLERISAELGA